MEFRYKIVTKKSVEHDLKKCDRKFIQNILQAIEDLAVNPFPYESKKMKGCESTYRLRVGDYRVIYQVETKKRIITIYYARHRKDAYKKQPPNRA